MPTETQPSDESRSLHVGGLHGSAEGAVEEDGTYCIITGQASLCLKVYRRLSDPVGRHATHWDAEVEDRDEAEEILPPGLELCPDCEAAGGWDFAENAINNDTATAPTQ